MTIRGTDGADDLRGQGGDDRLLGGLDQVERFYSDTCGFMPPGIDEREFQTNPIPQPRP